MTGILVIFIIFAMIFVLGPLAQAYARRLNPPEVRGVSPGEVVRLREELEQLASQVNRLQDEQSFMVRLLSEGDRRLLEKERGDAGAARAEQRDGSIPKP